MNSTKFSMIGHSALQICNPVGAKTLDHAISLLDLGRADNVVDIGAGKGEALIRVIETYGTNGTAIELEGGLITSIDQLAYNRIDRGKLKIHLGDAKLYIPQISKSLDLAICIGSSHALGDFDSMLTILRRTVKPGGQILIGEAYWKCPPDPQYLHFLKCEVGDLKSHVGNIQLAESLGYTTVWSSTTSQEDWDQYEDAYSRALESYVSNNPNDPDSDAILKRIRSWRAAYFQWGRNTLGFGLYLFRHGSSA